MTLHHSSRSKKGLDALRISSAVVVLGMLVLVVAESAKYLYSAKIPDSINSKIEPSVDKLAAVLGTAKSSLGSLDIDANEDVKDTRVPGNSKESGSAVPVLLKTAVISDSHNDLEYLSKALDKIKNYSVDRVVFLGDYTDFGEVPNLVKAKKLMDSSGLMYVSIPGDHDLGETRDESNFRKVFGSTYGTFEKDGVKVMYFDNSKNFTQIDDALISWFDKEINDTDILFLSQPLVTEKMVRVMGIIDGVKDESVYEQNLHLLSGVRSSKVKVIVSGDLHQFSVFQDPIKAGLTHYTVGKVSQSQNLEKLNSLFLPRFSVLTVYNDSTYTLQDIPID